MTSSWLTRFSLKTAMTLAFASGLTLLPAASHAQQAIWNQPWDHQGELGPSSRTSKEPVDQEIADDFDVSGNIDVIRVEGAHIVYFNSPPMNLQSAYVRFYQWQNGTPGTLQYERLIPRDAITVTTDQTGLFIMNIPVPDGFAATGKHFVSVQTISDLGWYWRTSGTNNVLLAPAKIRDLNVSTAWNTAGQSDVTFALFGIPTGAPQLQNISDTTLPKSGRLRLFGSGFGTAQGTSEVRIGGVKAIVTRWSNTAINAYVPEPLAPGLHQVQVLTSLGSSTTFPLTVTNRTAPGGHIEWRFQADALGISTPPVVAPDGTIYVMDDQGNLYALTADGGLLWATKSGFQGSRLARGADGTLYTMADGILRATNADGTHKWDFTGDDVNFTISGPTVGPDGNIYGTVQYRLGFFSVTPEGQLRWSNPEVGDRIPRGHQVAFSNGQAYINHTHTDFPGLELMAFGMADGKLRWINEADRTSQPLIGPGGSVYVDWSLGVLYSRIYNPDGSIRASEQSGFGLRSFSPDLTKIYTNFPSTTQISAVDSTTRASHWTFNTGITLIGAPTADPFERFVLARTHDFGSLGNLFVLTSGGEFLWREDMAAENGGTIILTGGPVFSPSGNVAYTGSMIPGQNVNNEYSYVYAFRLAADQPVPSPVPTGAVSRKVHGSAGTFDIPLPLTGAGGIESRSGGVNGDYQVVVSFANPVTAKTASITQGSGEVASYSATGSEVIVNLTGVATGQRIMITLNGVNEGTNSGSVNLPLSVLVGDTSASGTVNATDVAQTKAQAGAIMTSSNFRADVNASGSVNSSDVGQVKANTGQALP